MNVKDKELWLKYAKQIKQVEAGDAFIVPTRIEPLADVMFNHCAEPAELWFDLMAIMRVPISIRKKARDSNRLVSDDSGIR